MPVSIGSYISDIASGKPRKPSPIASALQALADWANGNIVDADVKADAAIQGGKLDLTTGTGAITNTGNVTTTGDYDVSGKVDAGGGFYDDGAKFAEAVSTNLFRIYRRDGNNGIEIDNGTFRFSGYVVAGREDSGTLPSGENGMILPWKNSGSTAFRLYFYMNGAWKNAGPD